MQSRKFLIQTFIFFFFCKTTKAVLNFHDERFVGMEADRYNWTNHPCHRKCKQNEIPKICYYVFVVEMYSSMSKACYNCPNNVTDCSRPHCIPTDGVQKLLYTANRQMPGPTIEVCRHDIIVVDVRNAMLSDTTTIHWHGFKQRATPYMDGVPYVTQCPILPGQTFRYEFNATEDGTYFWHSHIGNQRVDGLYGALIVHPSFSNNYHKHLYDLDDHMMIVNDWTHLGGNSAEVKSYYDRFGTSNPDTILVNGMGRFGNFQRNSSVINTPLAVFNVETDKKHRFRVIDAGSEDCPIEISIDNHTLLVISLDSNDIKPVEVDVISIWPGERVDFILLANQEPGNYWIRFRGLALCAASNTSQGAYQVGILRYDTAPIQEPVLPISWDLPARTNETRVLNPYQINNQAPPITNVLVPRLTAMAPDDVALKPKADEQHFINFDLYPLDNYDFHREDLYGYNEVASNRRIGTFQLNHVSLKLPLYPLLSQYDMIEPGSICNETNIPPSCQWEHCACTHVINVKLNNVVELVFVDEGRYAVVDHPLHLHGHFFRIVAEANLQGNVSVDRIEQMDRNGQIKRRLKGAPLKDTMKAPGGGYTIVRFHADNPGYWFFHCHFEQHSNIGMGLIFKVGEHEDLPPKPRNFATCGNSVPDPLTPIHVTKKDPPRSNNNYNNIYNKKYYNKH